MIAHLRALRSEGNPRTLFAAFAYFDVSFMIWVILAGLGNYIADDLGLSGTEKGLMTALPVLSGAVLRLAFGLAADRFGGRRVGLIAMSLTLAPLAIGWLFADSLGTLYLVGILLGVAGASFAVALPLASRWYPPERQGLVLGIAGAGNSGTVLSSLFAPRLAEAFGWQAVLGLAMLPIAAVMVVFFLFAQDSPAQGRPLRLRDYAAVVRETDARWFCFFYAITFGGFVGLASYLAIFFHDHYALSKVTAGDLTAACVFAGSFVRPVGGLLADRLGGIPVLTTLLTLIGAALLLVSTMPPLAGGVPLLIAVMALLGMGNGSLFQLVGRRFRDRIGGVTGLVGACGGLGGFALPFLLGYGRDATDSYGPVFLGFAVAALLAAVALRGIGRGWHASWARVEMPQATGLITD